MINRFSVHNPVSGNDPNFYDLRIKDHTSADILNLISQCILFKLTFHVELGAFVGRLVRSRVNRAKNLK
jgi:hypothetical protein